jgi:hypothetical protein
MTMPFMLPAHKVPAHLPQPGQLFPASVDPNPILDEEENFLYCSAVAEAERAFIASLPAFDAVEA